MNEVNATYINKCIESMLPRLCDQGYFYESRGVGGFDVPLETDLEIIDDVDGVTGFSSDMEVIRELFEWNHSNNFITKNDILRQLVVIDSLYSANIKRMRGFALEEICDDIWILCDNGDGTHTLGALTSKVLATQTLNPLISALFKKSYGYVKGAPAGKAPSLISKYLYFATMACPVDKWGFPIYDSIANRLLPKLQRYLGIAITPQKQNTFDIDAYVSGLKSIIDVLEKNNPQLWTTLPVLKFCLLDYFLWHIGKAGGNSYSLLLSKQEVQSCYANGVVVRLPRRIVYWQQVYKELHK